MQDQNPAATGFANVITAKTFTCHIVPNHWRERQCRRAQGGSFKQKKARQPAHNRRAVKKSAQALFRPIHKNGLGATVSRRRRWLPKSEDSLDGTAPTPRKDLRTKKSPATSAFAAQPLGDSLKTRRLSRFAGCRRRSLPTSRQAFAKWEAKGFSGKLRQAQNAAPTGL